MTDITDNRQELVPHNVSILDWVEASKADPVGYRNRQVTYILLSAIGLTPQLQETMFLKGGALMMLGFGSPRGTQDVDFTVAADPEPFSSDLQVLLNPSLTRAANTLGYSSLICRVQKIDRRPKTAMFEAATGPALSITIAHARRGTNEEKRFNEGQSVYVLKVDLSFKEPVLNQAVIKLDKTNVAIKSYALEDIVAEKFRALLQQPERNRTRRQDVYDLAWLAKTAASSIDDTAREKILVALREKSAARGITPTVESIDDPEVAKRASSKWDTLGAELGDELPPFEEAFATTREFYVSLPWNVQQ